MFKIKVNNFTVKEIEELFNIKSVDTRYQYVLIDSISLYEENFVNIIFDKINLDEMKKVVNSIKKAEDYYLILRAKNGMKRVNIKSIEFLEVVNNEINVYVSKEVFFLSERLKVLEDLLKNKGFIRISKSIIVNLNFISNVLPIDNYKLSITLRSGINLEVNRLFTKAFKEKMFQKEDIK